MTEAEASSEDQTSWGVTGNIHELRAMQGLDIRRVRGVNVSPAPAPAPTVGPGMKLANGMHVNPSE